MEEGIPSWAGSIIADTSYVRARVDSMASTVTEVSREVDKLQATQVPMSEHIQLVADMRQIRDQVIVFRAIASWAAAGATGAVGYVIAHFAGWVH